MSNSHVHVTISEMPDVRKKQTNATGRAEQLRIRLNEKNAWDLHFAYKYLKVSRESRTPHVDILSSIFQHASDLYLDKPAEVSVYIALTGKQRAHCIEEKKEPGKDAKLARHRCTAKGCVELPFPDDFKVYKDELSSFLVVTADAGAGQSKHRKRILSARDSFATTAEFKYRKYLIDGDSNDQALLRMKTKKRYGERTINIDSEDGVLEMMGVSLQTLPHASFKSTIDSLFFLTVTSKSGQWIQEQISHGGFLLVEAQTCGNVGGDLQLSADVDQP